MNINRFFYRSLKNRLDQPNLPFLQVLIGPRQVGKSTAITQITRDWRGSTVFESADRVSPPNSEWIEFLWQKALEQPAPCLLALDEIQKVRGWSETVKILFDRDRHKSNLRVILSGSASLSIQKGLNESLAGRYELIRCPHWGLDESHAAFGWDLTTYLKFGGYPAAAPLIDQPERWQSFIRDGIVEPVIGRDLQAMINIQKPGLLRQLFELAVSYPAQEISYQKLLGQLQDRGNVATIRHYLDILAGGFLITTLEKYSKGVVTQKSSSPKILPMAPALIHAFINPMSIDNDPEWRGRVFEAAIGAHLKRLPAELYYWRDGTHEVDFVLTAGRDLYAIEVKSGRKKNYTGLQAFKKKFPDAKTIVIDWEFGKNFLSNIPTLKSLEQKNLMVP